MYVCILKWKHRKKRFLEIAEEEKNEEFTQNLDLKKNTVNANKCIVYFLYKSWEI